MWGLIPQCTLCKTHRMGRAWEIGAHTFDIVWILFSYQISILWHTSSHGKCMFFLIKHGKRQPNSSNGKSLGNRFAAILYKTHCMRRTWKIGTHTFPIVWVLFSIRFPFYGILHCMENTWVFSSNFP